MLEHFLGNMKRLVGRPAIGLFRELDFFGSKWRAVGAVRVNLIRRAIGDLTPHDDQRWYGVIRLEFAVCCPQGGQVVDVINPQYEPS